MSTLHYICFYFSMAWHVTLQNQQSILRERLQEMNPRTYDAVATLNTLKVVKETAGDRFYFSLFQVIFFMISVFQLNKYAELFKTPTLLKKVVIKSAEKVYG